MDSNNILTVSAKDKASGAAQSIAITNEKGRLSKDEIEKMVQDAEKFKAEDEAAKERINAKNELENYAYSVKNTINDDKFKDKISDEDKKAVEEKVTSVIGWLDSADNAEKEEFEGQKKDLESVVNPIMAKLYQAAGGGAEGGMPEGMPGGMPSGMPGGMPDMGQPESGGDKGPKIEELD